MSQETGEAIAMLAAGVILGAVAVWRIHFGTSYISRPAARVSRQADPFSFWLSVGPLLLVAFALVALGLARLISG